MESISGLKTELPDTLCLESVSDACCSSDNNEQLQMYFGDRENQQYFLSSNNTSDLPNVQQYFTSFDPGNYDHPLQMEHGVAGPSSSETYVLDINPSNGIQFLVGRGDGGHVQPFECKGVDKSDVEKSIKEFLESLPSAGKQLLVAETSSSGLNPVTSASSVHFSSLSFQTEPTSVASTSTPLLVQTSALHSSVPANSTLAVSSNFASSSVQISPLSPAAVQMSSSGVGDLSSDPTTLSLLQQQNSGQKLQSSLVPLPFDGMLLAPVEVKLSSGQLKMFVGEPQRNRSNDALSATTVATAIHENFNHQAVDEIRIAERQFAIEQKPSFLIAGSSSPVKTVQQPVILLLPTENFAAGSMLQFQLPSNLNLSNSVNPSSPAKSTQIPQMLFLSPSSQPSASSTLNLDYPIKTEIDVLKDVTSKVGGEVDNNSMLHDLLRSVQFGGSGSTLVTIPDDITVSQLNKSPPGKAKRSRNRATVKQPAGSNRPRKTRKSKNNNSYDNNSGRLTVARPVISLPISVANQPGSLLTADHQFPSEYITISLPPNLDASGANTSGVMSLQALLNQEVSRLELNGNFVLETADFVVSDCVKTETSSAVRDVFLSTEQGLRLQQIENQERAHETTSAEQKLILRCSDCEFTCEKSSQLNRHMRSAHSEARLFRCQICDRTFKSSVSLKNHINVHMSIRPHRCELCDATFTTAGELVRHKRYKHTHEKPHKCTYCQYVCVELSKLRRHIRSHTGEKPFHCHFDGCSYASPDTYKLKRHLRVHTGERPYECDICLSRFSQSNTLKAHRIIHNTERSTYSCPYCDSVLGRSADLRFHIRKLHTSRQPLLCPKRCGEILPDRHSLKTHLLLHRGEKLYKCPVCTYASASQRMLNSHALIHTDAKPYVCEIEDCNARFRQPVQLRRHFNLKHNPDYVAPLPNEKKYVCERCCCRFHYQKNLLRHLQQHDVDDILEHEEAELPETERQRRRLTRELERQKLRDARRRKIDAGQLPIEDAEHSEQEDSDWDDELDMDGHAESTGCSEVEENSTVQYNMKGASDLRVQAGNARRRRKCSGALDISDEFIPNCKADEAAAADVSSSVDVIALEDDGTVTIQKLSSNRTGECLASESDAHFRKGEQTLTGKQRVSATSRRKWQGKTVTSYRTGQEKPTKRSRKPISDQFTRIKRRGRPKNIANLPVFRQVGLEPEEDSSLSADAHREVELQKEVEQNFGFSEVASKLVQENNEKEQLASPPPDDSCIAFKMANKAPGSDLTVSTEIDADFDGFPHFAGDRLRSAHRFKLDFDDSCLSKAQDGAKAVKFFDIID